MLENISWDHNSMASGDVPHMHDGRVLILSDREMKQLIDWSETRQATETAYGTSAPDWQTLRIECA